MTYYNTKLWKKEEVSDNFIIFKSKWKLFGKLPNSSEVLELCETMKEKRYQVNFDFYLWNGTLIFERIEVYG